MPNISPLPLLARPHLARLLLATPLLALAACGSAPSDAGKSAEATPAPTAPSSEWVQPNPTEPAVPVALPTT